jgi:hypothetical protein
MAQQFVVDQKLLKGEMEEMLRRSQVSIIRITRTAHSEALIVRGAGCGGRGEIYNT